jgi:hypothetical protein
MILALVGLSVLGRKEKYVLAFYHSYALLHGHETIYQLQYKDIIRGVLLPRADGTHIAFILELKQPLRQGQTLQQFVSF